MVVNLPILWSVLILFAQASGVKVGEVTDTSAIVWTRVTAKASREPDGSCPGAAGKVRITYGDATTDWVEVTAASDFTHQFRLSNLRPATVYSYTVEFSQGGPSSLTGRFETAPSPSEPAETTFAVITGQAYKDLDHPDGFAIYEAMAKLNPKFIVPTGDTVYYDSDPPLATTPALARLHWERMYSLPRHIAFHLRVPAYWEKDDHDTWFNDCWPTMKLRRPIELTFDQGVAIFRRQVPFDKPYRSVRWGKTLQLWLVEGRDYRSANTAPDGPDKSIWGAEQKAWFKKTVSESDAQFKVLLSPTPLVGPDRAAKGDNHANKAFAVEGAELRRFLKERSVFIACGDRHWQYHSVDPATGAQEFSCGPASDKHAGGSPGENPALHKFHRVKGGFLSVTAGPRAIVFRLHDVDGRIVYEVAP